MSYSVNGKVQTDHPLMDEMVFNLNRIMYNIVLKNESRALDMESEQSLDNSAVFLAIKNDRARFETFPFTAEMLSAYGYNSLQVTTYLRNREKIPVADRDDLMELAKQIFLDSYEETNDYYRTLMGYPEYGSGEAYYVYIDASYFKDPVCLELVDLTKPVHLMDQYEISLLDMDGGLTRLTDTYRGDHYEYLKYLGDRRIDLYKARQAAKWDILYMPSVEHLVETRYKQIFLINKEQYLQRLYSDAYKLQSDAYEECMMVMLLCQTYADMIADIPEWYIRRDVFDLRSCQYFIESHGVKFFKQIPLKYQVNIVRNLNKLIRYKSTNQNIWDILDLFGMEDVEVFKYYLLKRRKVNSRKKYVVDENGNPVFDMEFIKTPIGDIYDNTIKDNIYRVPYNDLTLDDKYWDGENTHSYVEQQHLDKGYTIEGTKYMSLDLVTSMTEYQFQLAYFLGMILDSNLDDTDIKINVPSISPNVSFPLSDLFLLLYCLTASFESHGLPIEKPINTATKPKPPFEAYIDIDGGGVLGNSNIYDLNGGPPEDLDRSDFNGFEVRIPLPNNADIVTADGKYPDWPYAIEMTEEDTTYYDLNGGCSTTQDKFRRPINGGGPKLWYTRITQESFYDWIRWGYDYLWFDTSDRVLGFNLQVDLKELEDLISMKHSSFQFKKGYTLADLGVDGFVTASSVDSIDEMIKIYKTNKEAHDNLYYKMTQAETRDDLVVYRFVYDILFTKPLDEERFRLKDGSIATDYEQILKEHSLVLWKYLKDLSNEIDPETRQDSICQALNDIVNILEYYINDDALRYLFAFTSISSLDSVLKYIYLMVDFFKSYKVYFLDPYATFSMDNKVENTHYMNDILEEIEEEYWKIDHHHQYDAITIEEELDLSDHQDIENVVEILDIEEQYEPIPGFDMDINGKYITDPDELERDFDGGGVEAISYSPYIMLNGGRVATGWNVWDLDGAGPDEKMFYLEADGKYADNEIGEIGSAETTGYNVDGGHPDFHMFTTRSMTVRIIDNQIQASVNLFKSNQNIVKEDASGLLISTAEFATESELYLLDVDLQDFVEYYSKAFNDSLDEIRFCSDPETVSRVIDSKVDNYFVTARTVIKNAMEDITLNEMKQYTDQRVMELEELFTNFNILGWGNF